MTKKRIFIHIPKTGGTTLDCAITGSQWMVKHDLFQYRHIQHDTKLSNAGDIFQKMNFQKYQEYDLYTMLRHPVDRLVSEYFFVRDRKEYFSLIKGKPKTLLEFANNVQSRNYMLNFLVGGRIYPNKPVDRSALDRVIETIDQMPIYVGIFEEFEKSLQYFSDEMSIKWPKHIEVKRVTLNRPKINDISDEVKETIIKNNVLDMELYQYFRNKFETLNLTDKKVKITKDKYEYIMKYTERFILAELYMKDKSFLRRNAGFFKSLNLFLHKQMNFKEGRSYANNWNRIFVESIHRLLPELEIDSILKSPNFNDPLINTKEIASFLEKNCKSNFKLGKLLMKFNSGEAKIIPHEEDKPGFLKRIFG